MTALCTIGEVLQERCDNTSFTSKIGLLPIASFSNSEKILIALRSGVNQDLIDTVCQHHKCKFLLYYENYQVKCADPFLVHKRPVKSRSLRAISLIFYEQHNSNIYTLIPGQKLCVRCFDRIGNLHTSDTETTPPKNTTTSTVENDCEFELPEETLEKANQTLESLGETPVKRSKFNTRQIEKKISTKVEKVTRRLNTQFKKGLGIKEESSSPSTSRDTIDSDVIENSTSLMILVDEMKNKFHSSCSYEEKLSILTLVPEHWSIEETKARFKATSYMVRLARKIKEEHGILGRRPPRASGRQLSEDVKKTIIDFYRSEENSRVFPGKKDVIAVKDPNTGNKVHLQKHLILSSLKELYVDFKQKTLLKIGFSSFAALRPKDCVLAGAPGTHNVCVCVHHQNPKLKLHALSDSNINFQYFLQSCVCSAEEEACMMHACHSCPGLQNIKKLMQNHDYFNTHDEMSFCQWTHTDRFTLLTVTMAAEDFIESLSSEIWELTKHHFVYKAQATFLTASKERLGTDTCIMLMDFAENYSFIVQDAVQSFHWDHTQCTLHPFVVYTKTDGSTLQVKNFCIVSDGLKHSTAAVNLFMDRVLEKVKTCYPQIQRVMYFSDGCAGQYKNRFNFANLANHDKDFHLKAEWHFFATSHGKSPCDGLAGTIKRMTAKASLQRPLDSQILNPIDVYNYAEQNIQGIQFIWVTAAEIEEHDSKLRERYTHAKKVAGTRKYHSFIPISSNQLEVKVISNSSSPGIIFRILD